MALSQRLVDFALTLQLPRSEENDIVHILADLPTPLRYLNQTTYDPLRFRPSPIAIETKTDTPSSSGRSQLAVWTQAWFHRMRLLCPSSSPPPVPLIKVVGHCWSLLFAWEDEEGNFVLMGEQGFGTTQTLVGTYKIMAGLRVLGEWMEGPFKAWFDQNVLEYEDTE